MTQPETKEAGCRANDTGPKESIKHLDFARLGDDPQVLDDKQFSTLQAHAAMVGFQLRREGPADASADVFVISRWNLSRQFSTTSELRSFLDAVGAR